MQLEDIRHYLREYFQKVTDFPPEGDYHVLGVVVSGTPRTVKVHREFLSDRVPSTFLRDHRIANQLENGNVELYKPL